MSDEALPPRVPMSEAEILAATVVELAPRNAPIELCDYDPGWPDLFDREAARVRSILGDQVRQLEHVGSTSVPGLAAKPVIDIALVLRDSSDESTYLPGLEAAGYVLWIREPEWYEHRVFKGPDTNVNLHVYTQGCPEIERYLLFRERLRTHDDERDLYERTKRELAARDWRFVQQYADAKTEVVEGIIARARAGGSDDRHEVTDAQ